MPENNQTVVGQATPLSPNFISPNFVIGPLPNTPPWETPHKNPPKEEALRDNKGKVLLSMVPTALKVAVANVLEFGMKKYARDNWMKGFKYTDVLDSLERHLEDWKNGEDYDKESGLNHMWHVACNVAFLCHFIARGTGTDNRTKL